MPINPIMDTDKLRAYVERLGLDRLPSLSQGDCIILRANLICDREWKLADYVEGLDSDSLTDLIVNVLYG